MPLLALPGNPDHRDMGETLPEELGEYTEPGESSVPVSPGPPRGLEPASSSSCEFSGSAGEGGAVGEWLGLKSLGQF